jgi:hypothetical protein
MEVISVQTDAATVYRLWCRLTGTPLEEFSAEEREAFLGRPQIAELAATPYEVLLDAGIDAARHGVLPLERWLNAVHTVRPVSA